MIIIPPHNHYDKEHLEDVIVQMKLLGRPTLRAVHYNYRNKYTKQYAYSWIALEGTHRIRAAHRLGLVPNIIQIKYSTTKYVHDFEEIDLMYNCTIAQYVKGVRSNPFIFEEETSPTPSGVPDMQTLPKLPEPLFAAYNWTDAAGELDELRDLDGAELERYCTESADNAAENDRELHSDDAPERDPPVTSDDLYALHDWLVSCRVPATPIPEVRP